MLSYIKIQESSVYWISNERYRIISFRVSEFLEFIGKEKTNYYQIRKLVDFLESLQTLHPIRQYFSDGGFRSALIFPYLEVRRKKSWCVELAVSERLYFYFLSPTASGVGTAWVRPRETPLHMCLSVEFDP